MGTRIPSLVVKEMLALFRDPKSRIVLIMPPLLQLIIFAFAATLEVKNISLAIYNEDTGKHGMEIVQRFNGSPFFPNIFFVQNEQDIDPAIDQQQALAAVHIPANFSRNIEANDRASLQVILDGRRSNAAQIANGYIAEIVNRYNTEITTRPLPVIVVARNWFNENLLYLWFTIPSLVAILSMLIALIVTALSVARERELGTFDQLLVSPLTPMEILIGKTIPAIVIGMAEGCLIWAVAVTVFKVPFTGSPPLLLFALFIFVMSIVGIGLAISSVSKTQQQAILGAFVFMVPAVTLSGYAAPVENMPEWLQAVTSANPLKHFLITVKGLFLKDMPFADVWTNTWPLLVIGVVTLSLASWFFARRME